VWLNSGKPCRLQSSFLESGVRLTQVVVDTTNLPTNLPFFSPSCFILYYNKLTCIMLERVSFYVRFFFFTSLFSLLLYRTKVLKGEMKNEKLPKDFL
jgi:hypothetical protein